jgi:hypothetical protein
MLTGLILAFIFLRAVRLRERLHNGMQPLRHKKQYQVQKVQRVSTHFFVLRKNRKIVKLFPAIVTCTIVAYDCLNQTTKGQPFKVYKVHFRETPVVGKRYTVTRKKKFSRLFFEEKIIEQSK